MHVPKEYVEEEFDGPLGGPDEDFAYPKDEGPNKRGKTAIRARISHLHWPTDLVACVVTPLSPKKKEQSCGEGGRGSTTFVTERYPNVL